MARIEDDDRGCAFGDEQGRADLSRETSRRTKARPRIRGFPRYGSYTQPTESGAAGPTSPVDRGVDDPAWRGAGRSRLAPGRALPCVHTGMVLDVASMAACVRQQQR